MAKGKGVKAKARPKKTKNVPQAQAAQPAPDEIDYSTLQPMQPSKALAEIVGPQPLLHSEASRRIWTYVKSHGLQDPTNKLLIKPDKKLASIVGDKALSTVELTRAVREQMREIKQA